jgi:repressor LexA
MEAYVDITLETAFPPTIRQLAAVLGIVSTNCVHQHIDALIRKGYLEVTDGKRRGYRILKFPNGTPCQMTVRLIPTDSST